MSGEVGWTQLRNHLLRQHRPGHVNSVPVRQYGGVDANSILGKIQEKHTRPNKSSFTDVSTLFPQKGHVAHLKVQF